MKSGSGSSSPNEDVSRHQPFTQLCLRRLNEFGDALTMPAPSSTVLNTSDQNYQAMLTTEPLDTANIVDVPADLSTPFDYLTNTDTDADNADLP
jgi:hypothetical protein